MNESEPKLTEKQLKAIPLILGGRTIEEGCKRAKVSKTSFYEWLKNPQFKDEFIRQRNEIVTFALDELKASTGEAVQVLRNLLKAKKEGIRLRAAMGIIEYVNKFIEFEGIEKRLEAIERRLNNE